MCYDNSLKILQSEFMIWFPKRNFWRCIHIYYDESKRSLIRNFNSLPRKPPQRINTHKLFVSRGLPPLSIFLIRDVYGRHYRAVRVDSGFWIIRRMLVAVHLVIIKMGKFSNLTRTRKLLRCDDSISTEWIVFIQLARGCPDKTQLTPRAKENADEEFKTSKL